MNVLIALPWDQQYGGVASVAGNLGKYLKQQGHNVLYFHPCSSRIIRRRITKWGFQGFALDLPTVSEGKRLLRSRIAFCLWLPVVMMQLAWIVRRNRIHVINVHYPGQAFVYFAFLRWMSGVKLVTSIHGADLFPRGRRMDRYAAGLKFLLSSSDAIVAPSQSFRRECLAVFPGLEPKARVVYNGIDLDEIGTAQQEQGAHVLKRFILCIAEHNQKKAIDVLIAAFSCVMKEGEDLLLVLVGAGPLLEQHRIFASALGISERVVFLGNQPRHEIFALLNRCELFVLASRSEPFGIVLAEAMACGKPIVASAVGGIPEILGNGECGMLVEPDNPLALADAVRTMLEDDVMRSAMASRGYARVVEQFQTKHTGAGYEHVFRAVTSQPGRAVNADSHSRVRPTVRSE